MRTRSLLVLNDKETKKVANAYKENKKSIFLNGEKFLTGDLVEIQIFTIESPIIKTGDELFDIMKKDNHLETGYFGDAYVSKKVLKLIGKNVTSLFIKDEELEKIEYKHQIENYIDLERLKELKVIKSNKFDLTRLVAVLKEINVANENSLKFSIPLLVRSIIDQVPPIFGKSNFADVCGSHGSKSFKESMIILNKSSRKIADAYLHTHIRKHESALPTLTQINFKNDVDVLLQEIIRVIKSE